MMVLRLEFGCNRMMMIPYAHFRLHGTRKSSLALAAFLQLGPERISATRDNR